MRSICTHSCVNTAITVFLWLALGVALDARADKPFSKDGNRLAYLDEIKPYYPSRDFAKLVTPQWVGDKDVQAVVILSIDDMRNPGKYENYLRPILDRLKKVKNTHGKSPVSIFTNVINPKDPKLQGLLKEGLSFEVHTIAHPCPCLGKFDLAKAKQTYHECVDLLTQIPNYAGPVAFRMPCCDSMNSVSPRFYAEVMNGVSKKGNFLQIDSSVFQLFTANDPDLPRDLVLDKDGKERFRKYIPKGKGFVNFIEDYPYPYTIGNMIWQFPSVIPSDWEAQHLHGSNNPRTVEDLKAAIDCTVIKQGVFTLTFHPHRWIKAEQIVELIDHIEKKHGNKVKFLNFKDAAKRLNKNLLKDIPLRNESGQDNSVRIVDSDNDGFMDVSISQPKKTILRKWNNAKLNWRLIENDKSDDDPVSFRQVRWFASPPSVAIDRGESDRIDFINRDLNGDCFSEQINNESIYDGKLDEKLAFTLPKGVTLRNHTDVGVRFVDIDADGNLDILHSIEKGLAIYLFNDEKQRWERLAFEESSKIELFSFIRADGSNNGFFIKNRALYWQNEDTGHLPGNVHKVTFDQLLAAGRTKKGDSKKQGASKYPPSPQPNPMTPAQSMRAMEISPGFKVELVAAEPLVVDPVAFDWGPDGKLWVVEMGDYPTGVDAPKTPGKFGKPGGRVVYLTDTNNDGQYDKRTIFREGLSFPTGVMAWDKGVLVTMAPYVFYAEDQDGDGKADGRVNLFEGFGEGNQQHRVNGLRWGLDNWIHIANGDSGGVIRSTMVANNQYNCRGRDVKIQPYVLGGMTRTGRILDEDELHGFSIRCAKLRNSSGVEKGVNRLMGPWVIQPTSGQTQFGRNRDDWGNWFGSNNPSPGWQYVLRDHYLRRNPHVASPDTRAQLTADRNVYAASHVYSPSISNHKVNPGQPNPHTSANSLIIYRDDYFGPNFASTYNNANAFISEPVHNLIRRHSLRRKGLVFEASRAPGEENREFLASRDIWFRPSMLRTGPDGCLWVADIYRHVIEHPKWIQDDWEATLNLRDGADKGRIYRVVRIDRQPRPAVAPRLNKLTLKELVAALDSPNGWQRDQAHMLLLTRGALAKEKNKAIKKGESDLTLLKPDSTAFIKTRQRLDKLIGGLSFVAMLENVVRKSDRPTAQLHALCILDGLNCVRPSVLLVARSNKHPALRQHAIRAAESVVIHSDDELLLAIVDFKDETNPAVRLQLAYSLGQWRSVIAGKMLAQLFLQSDNDRYLRAAVLSSALPHLDALLNAVLELPDESRRGPLLQTLITIATKSKKTEALATVVDRILKPKDGRYAAWQYRAMLDLIASRIHVGKEQRAALKAMATVAYKTVNNASIDPKANLDSLIAAIKLIGVVNDIDHRGAIRAIVSNPRASTRLQQVAALVLLDQNNSKAIKLLLTQWRNYSPAVRSTITASLVQNGTGITHLLDAVEAKHISLNDLSTSRKQQLFNHKSDAIKSRAVALLGSQPNPARQKVITQYGVALRLAGDPARGKTVFQKNCAACHQLAGIGKGVGPDLRTVKNGSPQALLAAILDPNQAVESKYLNYIVEMKDGDTLTGIITKESGGSFLLTGVDGIEKTLLRQDVESLRSGTKSLMPDGLEQAMRPQDVADVITFIGRAGPLPKQFANNRPRLIQAGNDGKLNLLANAAEIYGPSIIFEQKYRNLGWWSHENDHAVWTIKIKQAGDYRATFDWALPKTVGKNAFQIAVDGAKLTGPIPGTGSWDNYKRKAFGQIRLLAGTHRLTIQSRGPISGALIDLRGIELEYVK